MLEGMAARLEDEDGHVRQAAMEALQGRADLPEKVLEGIAARFEDEDWIVRQAAIEALRGRADLPEKMLKGMAARLEDEDRDIRQAAIETLINQAALPLDDLSSYAKPLYKALLQKSFEQHLYWYDSGNSFIGVHLGRISLSSRQYHEKGVVVNLLVEKDAIAVAKDGIQQPPLHLLSYQGYSTALMETADLKCCLVYAASLGPGQLEDSLLHFVSTGARPSEEELTLDTFCIPPSLTILCQPFEQAHGDPEPF
ncbi:hypothetical protein V8F06_001931 [Rhypophila decipiens]